MRNIFVNHLKENKILYITFLIFLIIVNLYQIINPFLAFDELYVYSPLYINYSSNIYYRELYEYRIIYGVIQDILAYIKPNPAILIICGIIFKYIFSILCLFYLQLKGIRLNLIFKLSFLIAMNFTMLAFAISYPDMMIYFVFVIFSLYCWIIYENNQNKKTQQIYYILFIFFGFICISWYSGNLYFLTYLLLISYLFKIYYVPFNIKNYVKTSLKYVAPIIIWIIVLFIIHYIVKWYYNGHNVYPYRDIKIDNHYSYIKNLIPIYLQIPYVISFILILYYFKQSLKNFIFVFISLVIFLLIPISSDIFLHKGGTQLRLMYLHIYLVSQLLWCAYLYSNIKYKFFKIILYLELSYLVMHFMGIYFANAISIYNISYNEKKDIVYIQNKYQELCPQKDCEIITYGNLPWDYYDKYKFTRFKHYIDINHSFFNWKYWFKENLYYYGINASNSFFAENLANNTDLAKIINNKLQKNEVYPNSNAIFEENYNNIKTIFIILGK